jgi:hypothetical protein
MPLDVFGQAVLPVVEFLWLWLLQYAVDRMVFSSLICNLAFGYIDKLLICRFLAIADEGA